MPIIVLEGPDESGKTTLARKLEKELSEAFPGPHDVEYQRSPVKEHGWSDEYNRYLPNLASVSNHLVIQDRIPEISESIYGYVRGNARNHGWLFEAGDWFDYSIFIVFCKAPSSLSISTHNDATGRFIDATSHDLICDLYNYTYQELEKLVVHGRLNHFRVGSYDRLKGSKENQWLWYHLWYWLVHIFPKHRGPIAEVIERIGSE